MKLSGEVIEVKNCGESIEISMQAKVGRAKWRSIERHTFRVEDTVPNRKAFHIGRIVTVTIKPN